MAAGRVDVSRRRVSSYGWSGKDEATVLRGSGNHRAASGAHSFEFRRSGFSCANEERELGGLWGRKGVDQSPGLEDGEIRKEEDGVQMPPEKKRKFSPIIWDLEDKKVARTGSSVITSFAASAAKLHQLTVVSDEDSVIESASLHLETRGDDDLDPGEVEEDGVVEARNISQSRWASDDDSPRESTISYKRSSPEDFEFRIEVSVGDESTFYGSSDGDCRLSNGGEENSGNELESDEPMDCNEDDHDGDTYTEPDDDIDKKEETGRGINMLESCRSVFEFEKLNEISEGTYGKVFKARDKKNGKLVALKKVKMNVGGDRNLEVYGFPISALREMNILLSLQHPSIVNVQEVVMDDLDGVYMVMEYMEHDLKGVMQVMKHPFSTSEVKCLMLQLLEGVKYLHDNWVIHRDLKTPNLLLNNQGELKICDFGMSRQYGSPLKPYTSLVVTLWYRAPELLLGAKQYSTAIDMWSVGCIMAELLAKEPLFNGKSEIDQLHKIFKTLGTPNETIWPGLSKLPGAKANFVKNPYNLLRKKFPAASFTGTSVLSESGFDLLNRLLTYDPAERITAETALNHPWFQEVPLPKSKEFMPTFPPQKARNA